MISEPRGIPEDACDYSKKCLKNGAVMVTLIALLALLKFVNSEAN